MQVYNWIGSVIPPLDEIKEKGLLVQNCLPETLKYKPDIERKHEIKLITTSQKTLPEKNLTFWEMLVEMI